MNQPNIIEYYFLAVFIFPSIFHKSQQKHFAQKKSALEITSSYSFIRLQEDLALLLSFLKV